MWMKTNLIEDEDKSELSLHENKEVWKHRELEFSKASLQFLFANQRLECLFSLTFATETEKLSSRFLNDVKQKEIKKETEK